MKRHNSLISCALVLLAVVIPELRAELVVTPSRPQVVGDTVVVTLQLRNDLEEPIEAARAVVFLQSEDGKLLDHRAQWVIGGRTGGASLEPGATKTFLFVLTRRSLRARTRIDGLQSQVMFNRLVLAGGRIGSVKRDVKVEASVEADPGR